MENHERNTRELAMEFLQALFMFYISVQILQLSVKRSNAWKIKEQKWLAYADMQVVAL